MGFRQALRDRRQLALLEWARAGRVRAFTRLYRELYDPVARYIAARVRPREEAEDLTAEVFQKFLAGLQSYDARRGSVWTWTFTIARNTLIDHLRRRRESESLETLAEILADGRADPLASLVKDEEARFACGILQGYPAETREMFSLRFACGLRTHEIAQVMGISHAAVKQRFSRTLRQLRLELEGQQRKGGEEHATWTLGEAPQERVSARSRP